MALFIAYRAWTETKSRGIFSKKGVFWESGYLTYIYYQNDGCDGST